jgi:type III pantothenate kinase
VLLAVDVGNTHTKLALFDGDRLTATWRMTTRPEASADDLAVGVTAHMASRGLLPRDVDGVAVANVVPSILPAIEAFAEGLFAVRALVVRGGPDSPIPLGQDQPERVGPDRIANAVAAVATHGTPVVVVDFGTATNIDCVSAEGRFVGGAIAPGLSVGADALFARMARLARVDLTRPHTAIGRDTTASLRAGILYGYAGLVDGLVERITAEMDGTPVVVATGGLATLVAALARRIDRVDPLLTLEGLRLIHARSRRATPSPSL